MAKKSRPTLYDALEEERHVVPRSAPVPTLRPTVARAPAESDTLSRRERHLLATDALNALDATELLAPETAAGEFDELIHDDDAGAVGVDDEDINIHDQEALNLFLGVSGADDAVASAAMALFGEAPSAAPARTVASLNLAALLEAERAAADVDAPLPGATPAVAGSGLRPEVLSAFQQAGDALHHLRCGRPPRALSMAASSPNWIELLQIMKCDAWTNYAVYLATRMFVNQTTVVGVEFLSNVLVPKVITDIRERKKLSYHLHRAILASIYRPSAFFRGFVFPLIDCADTTARVAAVVGGIIRKQSVPAKDATFALLLMSRGPFRPIKQHFINVFVSKDYALQPTVVNSIVDMYCRYKDFSPAKTLPLVWQRGLYIFAQKYRTGLSDSDRARLVETAKHQCVTALSAEVRRVLTATDVVVPMHSRGLMLPDDNDMMAE